LPFIQSGPGLSRRRLGAAALIALPAIVSATARAAARSVTFAGYGGWFQSTFDPLILGAFRKAHPDIAVFYYPVGNSYQALSMLRAQRSFPSTSVALLETGVAARATAEGLLEPLDAGSMPVLKDLIPRATQPNVAGPALMLDNLALGYNPTLITQVPRSWRALWNPVYGRRVVLQTPPDPLGLAMTAAAAGLYGAGDPKTSMDIAMTALEQLLPRVGMWDPIPDVYTAIATGDAGLGPCWNARAQAQAAMTPGRFAAIIPDEGGPYLTTTVNLIKGSQQSEPARTLIAWLLGPEAQRLLVEAMFYAPVNTKADIPAAALSRVGATPVMIERRMEMDWIGITDARDQVTALWRSHGLDAH
jgi:putative spermidine/putrescine transport system substrate-binding protein